MLVLSRHRDESIIIGDDIVITVVDIRGDKVRLGIAAPIEISVHRQEVYEAIQRENRQASRLEPHDARQIDPRAANRRRGAIPADHVPTALELEAGRRASLIELETALLEFDDFLVIVVILDELEPGLVDDLEPGHGGSRNPSAVGTLAARHAGIIPALRSVIHAVI